MKKKFKIIILPTEKGNIVLDNDDKLTIKSNITGKCEAEQPQHLYILSEEEIKEGDIFLGIVKKTGFTPSIGTMLYGEITNIGKILHSVVKIAEKSHLIKINKSNLYKKAIASTDLSLNLPTIPEEYIKYYIEEYNKGNKLKAVELEIKDSRLININGAIKPVDTSLKLQNNQVQPIIKSKDQENFEKQAKRILVISTFGKSGEIKPILEEAELDIEQSIN